MIGSRFVIAALAVALLCAPITGLAENVLSGTWTIQPATTAGHVRLELRSDNERSQHDSSNYTPADLGLSASDISAPSHAAHFTMRRDAGSIDFTGTLGDGVGAGHYTFTPSAAYGDALAKRGYARPSIEEQLAATTLDISISYIDSIAATGVKPSEYGKLIAFRALGVTPQSIRDLRGQFGSLDESDVITFTALHITPQYAAEMRAAGVSGVDQHTLVTLRALHVDPAYIQELASVGYTNLTANQLTELKALHVDADYIRRVQAHGYKHPTVQQLVQLKALKII
jgi:hypothetical protein